MARFSCTVNKVALYDFHTKFIIMLSQFVSCLLKTRGRIGRNISARLTQKLPKSRCVKICVYRLFIQPYLFVNQFLLKNIPPNEVTPCQPASSDAVSSIANNQVQIYSQFVKFFRVCPDTLTHTHTHPGSPFLSPQTTASGKSLPANALAR